MSGSSRSDRFLSREEIEALGLARVGRDVMIDRSVTILRPDCVEIGDRSRVDLDVLISAGDEGVIIEENVHIAARCLLFGGGGRIHLHAFSGLSSLVACYTATDDYTGTSLFGPTVPDRFRNVQRGPVIIESFGLIGSGALLLPGTHIGEAAVIGAQTVISRPVGNGEILAGRPPRLLGRRDVGKMRSLAREYLQSIDEHVLAARFPEDL